MKNKIKTTSFWLGIGSSIVIVVSCISDLIGFDIGTSIIESIVVSICSVLVMLGIITKRTENDSDDVSKDTLIADIENFKDNDRK